MHKNNNRAVRKKIPQKNLQEFIKKSKEHYAKQMHVYIEQLEASKILTKSIIDTEYVAAHTLPNELYQEIYKKDEGDIDIENSEEILYGEQMFRLFPKEYYSGYLSAMKLSGEIHKIDGNRDDHIDFDEERGNAMLDELNKSCFDELDYKRLLNYRKDELLKSLMQLETDYGETLGMTPSLSGEEDVTTDDEKLFNPKTKENLAGNSNPNGSNKSKLNEEKVKANMKKIMKEGKKSTQKQNKDIKTNTKGRTNSKINTETFSKFNMKIDPWNGDHPKI